MESENERQSEELRMDAYYYGFSQTGIREIDLILSAVACAGKAFHHTESWNDEWEYEPHEGATPVAWIQNASEKAAAEIERLTRELAEAKQAVFSAVANGALYHQERDALRAEVATVREWCDSERKISAQYAQNWRDAEAALETAREALTEMKHAYEHVKSCMHKFESDLIKCRTAYAELFDKTHGTPCEQIRWEQELDAARAALLAHNAILRSAFCAAQRDAIAEVIGTTNYRLLADRAADVLDKHHAVVCEALASLPAPEA
jgi:hypothetical protein